MGKVKLTREQAASLRECEDNYGKDMVVIRHAEQYFISDDERKLTELTTAQVAKALYIGYEVEESYEVGDWVYVEAPKEGLPNVYKIMGVNRNSVNLDRLYGNHCKSKIRHATPEEIAKEKQRRWWAKHGRDVWELRKSDSLIERGERDYPDIVFEVGDFNIHFNDGFYYPKDYIKENYRVFCFAEDRKDVDHDN